MLPLPSLLLHHIARIAILEYMYVQHAAMRCTDTAGHMSSLSHALPRIFVGKILGGAATCKICGDH